MAGHSKWANIQHRKGAQDAKRGKLFTKLIREITVAAKLGGGDVSSNPRLRAAIDSAFSSNMTKDTVERAVKRGSGAQDGEDFEEITYEGYGPSGVAVLVLCLTDNRNRTVAEVRHAFSKAGGNLGTSGSVSYLFSKVGMIAMPEGTDEDALMDSALEAGAEDVVSHEDGALEVLTTPETLMDVKDAIRQSGMEVLHAEASMQASTLISLDDVDSAQKFLRLVDRLEDLDDVQSVYSNADIPTEIVDQL